MKITNIQINNFGKLKNKEINFKDGINIVYGENESGKSTVLKFINSMLYGASKNKRGKNISDFDKYKPWSGEENFSGKIKYVLDNNEEYEVFREFKKKNPKIYNSHNEDISKSFSIDKSKGINFFEEQSGISEELFQNTAIIGQQEIKLNDTDTNVIVQKISNLISTGDDNVSYKKSIDKINKMQNDSIGSDRTRQRPINIVQENIDRLLKEKSYLKEYKEKVNNHLEEKEKINRNIDELLQRKDALKKERKNIEKDEIKNIKTEFNKKIAISILIFFIIISILIFVFSKNIIAEVLSIISIVLVIYFMIRKNVKKSDESINIDIKQIDNKIEKIDNDINDAKVASKVLDSKREDIDEKLERLSKIEEELHEQQDIKEELISLNTSFNIAKECLERAYNEAKNNISPQFEKNLCKIVSNITNGKYDNVSVNDDNGLYVEIENGSYMPVDRLSIGTIDEMYLSLRLSGLSEISKENLPIMLDETFAYFDSNRLKNILCYLQDQFYNNQIIIFTCSNREEQLLNDLKIEYNLITLEK